jgi:hypothetical protein
MSIVTQVPVLSRISDEIFARLQALTAGDTGAYSFKGVVRPTRIATYTPGHGLIVLTRGTVERITELDCPGNPPAIAWRQTFLIRVHIAPSERDTTPVDRHEEVIEAEIRKAIRVDADWHTFDGNAITADFGPTVMTTSDGGYDGIAIPVIVTYRVAEDDPYTVRA